MNKKKKLIYVLGIISFLIGYVMILICPLNEKLDIPLTTTEKIILGMVGSIFVIVGITCLVKNYFKDNENSIIAAKDERNIMIRGKAAGISMLITIFVMLTVEFILICIGDSTAAFLVAIAMFLCGNIQLLLFCYYQKKY